MKHLMMILALSLTTAACGNDDLATLTKLKDEACACKDKACAEAVNKKLDAAVGKMKEPSSGDMKKFEEVMTQAGVCLAKLM